MVITSVENCLRILSDLAPPWPPTGNLSASHQEPLIECEPNPVRPRGDLFTVPVRMECGPRSVLFGAGSGMAIDQDILARFRVGL